MNDDPLFPEDELRAHLAAAPADSASPADEAWFAATCARAAAARLRRERRAARLATLGACAALTLLSALLAWAWPRVAPLARPVADLAATLAEVAWSLVLHAPALLLDGTRHLSLPAVAAGLLGLLLLESVAFALLRSARMRANP